MSRPAWLAPLSAAITTVSKRGPVVDLLGQLDRALEIAEGADLIGPALRNEVGPAAPRTHLGGNVVEDASRAPAFRVDQIADLHPQHPAQEKVPVVALGGFPVDPITARHPRRAATAATARHALD
jgi:hypothetical protein